MVPVMLAAASVKPGDVASNISEWLSLFGIHNLPSWITTKAADHWTIIGTIAFGVGYSIVIWILVPYISRQGTHLPPTTIQSNPEKLQERKHIIKQARELIQSGMSQGWSDLEFRRGLGASAVFYALRPNLSNEFMSYFSHPRMISVRGADGMTMVPRKFLDELDRLEREWGLV